MDTTAQLYRVGLIEAVIFLSLLLLAFGAVTILARNRVTPLGPTESLFGRLAAAIVLASISVGGLSGVILNLLQQAAFSDNNLTPLTSRNQAVLGIGLALAVTVVGIIRLEMYHRHSVSPPAPEEDAEWKVEPPIAGRPEIAGRR